VDPLFEIQGDREAMQYTYVAPDREATARHLASYAARFALDGFAPWTARLASEDRVIGWGGLNRDPKEPHWGIEVAYFLHRSCWGQGLASELVAAALHLAFRELGLPEVIAFTRPANRGSQRVLTKNGFAFVRHVPQLERDQYAVARRAWQAGA